MNTDYSALPKTFEMMQGGCYFAGTLYKRHDHGHDLYLNVIESELDKLDVAHITQLRRMSNDRKEVFVDQIPLGPLDPRLVRTSRSVQGDWLRGTLNVERTLSDRLKEVAWAVSDGESVAAFFRLWP